MPSQVPDVLHACGHDAHVSIALGVATLLAAESFPGTARFLFQPSEEREDEEGISGAPRMIEDGAMEGVDAVLALHVGASIPVGDIFLDAGPASAGVDTLYLTLLGRGGHGARPQETIDPVYISAHVILALNAIVSRRVAPFDQAVISIGSIHGGQVDNVIPDRVEMTATIRYREKEVQQQLHAEIERALGVAQALGGDYEYRIAIGYPPMNNDAKMVNLLRAVAADLLGMEHIQTPKPQMGAEDFGFFSDLAPGAMFMLGCQIEGDGRQHHNPRFDIDERCLPIGAAILAEAALRFLTRGA